jgi:thioredoxin-related protein
MKAFDQPMNLSISLTRLPKHLFAALTSTLLLLATVAPAQASSDYPDDDELDDDYAEIYSYLPPVDIKAVDDFAALGKLASETSSIILLEMTATYCEYCRLLEEEVLKPMLRSGDYDNKVLIRQLKIDSNLNIKDFDGSTTTPAELSSHYRIAVTPTLLILNEHGHELTRRIIGVQSLDFYAGIVDEALNRGLVTKGKELLISQ